MNIFTNFVKGLKKSFNGKDCLREIYQCGFCGKPSFANICQVCETELSYRKYQDK
tara:strand:- start:223 stop:387 length:165 start_codon:yes stop_codon:yes gene_type:complete